MRDLGWLRSRSHIFSKLEAWLSETTELIDDAIWNQDFDQLEQCETQLLAFAKEAQISAQLLAELAPHFQRNEPPIEAGMLFDQLLEDTTKSLDKVPSLRPSDSSCPIRLACAAGWGALRNAGLLNWFGEGRR